MNFKRTQVIANKKRNPQDSDINIGNKKLQKILHNIYLGQRISTPPSKEKEIKQRMKLG